MDVLTAYFVACSWPEGLDPARDAVVLVDARTGRPVALCRPLGSQELTRGLPGPQPLPAPPRAPDAAQGLPGPSSGPPPRPADSLPAFLARVKAAQPTYTPEISGSLLPKPATGAAPGAAADLRKAAGRTRPTTLAGRAEVARRAADAANGGEPRQGPMTTKERAALRELWLACRDKGPEFIRDRFAAEQGRYLKVETVKAYEPEPEPGPGDPTPAEIAEATRGYRAQFLDRRARTKDPVKS